VAKGEKKVKTVDRKEGKTGHGKRFPEFTLDESNRASAVVTAFGRATLRSLREGERKSEERGGGEVH